MRQIDADALCVQVEYSRKDNPYIGAPFGSLGAVYDIAHRHILKIIDDAPAVDAEPVVRCKDCEEYIPWGNGKICGLIGSYFGNTKPNDFCSRGRRR